MQIINQVYFRLMQPPVLWHAVVKILWEAPGR